MNTRFLVSILGLFCISASLCSPVFSQVPGWTWGRSALGKELEHVAGITSDRQGNVLVVGYYASDTLIVAKDTLVNSGVGFDESFLIKLDSAGNVLWARSAGGSGDDKGSAVTTDSDGNVYMTGYFYSPTLTFGSTVLTNAGVVGDIFIVKYSPLGTFLWAKREGGVGLEIPYGIASDAQGNFVIVGRYSSTSVVFGQTTLTLVGANDIFVVKHDSSGNVLWARGAGGGSIDEAFAVSLDAQNNVYVCGHFNSSAKFAKTTVISMGSSDIFLAKYDSSGSNLWVSRFGWTGDDRANALAVDAVGNCYLAGFMKSDAMTIGPSNLLNAFTPGITNAFLCKIDSSGKGVWGHSMNGKSTAYGIVFSGNNVYTCGGFTDDSLNYGKSVLRFNGSSDFYLTHCDTAGESRWAINQTSGGGSSETATALCVDQRGIITVAGDYGSHDPLVFGPNTLTPTANSFDMFIARLGSVSTGVEDVVEDADVLIYPNPSRGSLVIKALKVIDAVEVYSAQGQRVFSQSCLNTNAVVHLELPALAPGVYFVSCDVGVVRSVCRVVVVGE